MVGFADSGNLKFARFSGIKIKIDHDQKHSIQQQPKPSRQPTRVVESDIQTKPHGEKISIRSIYTLTVPIQPQ